MRTRIGVICAPQNGLGIGAARRGLMGWLFARRERGAFLLHLDQGAVSGVDDLCRDLAWLGIDWDEALSTAKQYRSLCQRCARQLGGRGLAYEAPLSTFEQRVEGHVPTGMWLRADPSIKDDARDILLLGRDRAPTSFLIGVVAAHERGITHLFCDRSALEDSNRQRLLCNALGWASPRYIHLPSIVDANRDPMPVEGWTVADLRHEGYLPLAVANQLARLGWTPRGKRALLSLEALIERFDLDRVQESPVVYDEQQLDWFGRRALSECPLSEVAQLMVPFWQEAYGLAHRATGTELDPSEWQCLLASAIRDEVCSLSASAIKARFALSDTVRYDDRALSVLSKSYAPPILEAFESGMAEVVPFAFASIDRFVSDLRWEFKASYGIRSRDVMHVIRAALTARIDGPCLVVACQLLGRRRCIERSRSARLERCRA